MSQLEIEATADRLLCRMGESFSELTGSNCFGRGGPSKTRVVLLRKAFFVFFVSCDVFIVSCDVFIVSCDVFIVSCDVFIVSF